MTQRIAHFEKVSLEQFIKDFSPAHNLSPEDIQRAYENLNLPQRATAGSAGYDFFTPIDLELAPGQSLLIPTGIRVFMDEGWVLQCFPRSGLGFRFRMQLDNTVGIIDADYVHAPNQGHIMARITNDSRQNQTLLVKAGDGFMQGVFLPFGLTRDDDAQGVRQGGFGSTSKK